MYYGLGPPGLDGIFEALGPMPPVIPSVPPHDSTGMERSPDPAVAPDSTAEPATNLPADNSIARPGDALPEEDVLGDVQDLAAYGSNGDGKQPSAKPGIREFKELAAEGRFQHGFSAARQSLATACRKQYNKAAYSRRYPLPRFRLESQCMSIVDPISQPLSEYSLPPAPAESLLRLTVGNITTWRGKAFFRTTNGWNSWKGCWCEK